jgi:cytochrome c
MKSLLPAVTLALAGLAAPLALAQNDLADKRKLCLSCHDIDAKKIGPGFKEVAARYAGQSDAVAKLTQKVLKGGAGVWGPVPMPANPQVNEAEAKQLVEWVLSQK